MRMMTMSGMSREDARINLNNLYYKIRHTSFCNKVYNAELEALEMAIADMEKKIQWQKTERFNRMIEAFECDFALIEQGKMTFAELDRLLKDKSHSLVTDMGLMQELSYLLRYGKAEIYVRGEEND